jgi:hypothetical protein
MELDYSKILSISNINLLVHRAMYGNRNYTYL